MTTTVVEKARIGQKSQISTKPGREGGQRGGASAAVLLNPTPFQTIQNRPDAQQAEAI